jgi:hypothetical protein
MSLRFGSFSILRRGIERNFHCPVYVQLPRH